MPPSAKTSDELESAQATAKPIGPTAECLMSHPKECTAILRPKGQ
jgi:hypothetical protein